MYKILIVSALLFIFVSRDTHSRTTFHKSIAKVVGMSKTKENTISQATAWAIDKDHLITVGHFCGGIKNPTVRKDKKISVKLIRVNSAGRIANVINGMAVSFVNEDRNYFNDICIIVSYNHEFIPLKMSNNFDEVHTEDTITVVGGPKGFFPVKRTGYVMQTRSDRKEEKNGLLISVLIQKGNSGSPVIWNNEVIGMVSRLVPPLQGAAFAIPIVEIKKYIKDNLP